MAKAPSSKTKASTPCTICCQLSETSFDSCGTVGSEISLSDMSCRARLVVLVSPSRILFSLERTWRLRTGNVIFPRPARLFHGTEDNVRAFRGVLMLRQLDGSPKFFEAV